MKFRTLLFLLLLVLTASTAHANAFGVNPFGFKMGLSRDEVKNLEGVVVDTSWTTRTKQVLLLSKVPVPDDRFVKFVLYFTEKRGLFTFHAISKDIPAGTGGSNLMPKYFELREELNEAYNGYTISHYVDNVAAWEPEDDWALKVIQRSGRDDFRAFLTNFRPKRYDRSEEVTGVELSISLGTPAQIMVIVDYLNYYDAVRGR